MKLGEIKDDKLLKKYKQIWNKISYKIVKEFDSKPIYNDKYIRAKVKSYNGKIDTDYHKIRNALRWWYLLLNNIDSLCF